MRIGIMTYWSWDNYGSILQCFALQKCLRNMGHEPFLIRYDPDLDMRDPLSMRLLRKLNPLELARAVKRRIRRTAFADNATLLKRKEAFAAFISERLAVSERVYPDGETLRADPPSAQAYIAGSDQIWNQGRDCGLAATAKLNRSYMLDFGVDDVRRIAYAASWGGSGVPCASRGQIGRLLARFAAVSVRETSGAGYCASCGRADAKVMPDPVFLLERKDYENISAVPSAAPGVAPYVFVYYLHNKSVLGLRQIRKAVEKHGKRLIVVTANDEFGDGNSLVPTPEEWLGLIRNAAYVITNSYHCCLFSLIFGKPFDRIPQRGFTHSQNDRFETLIRQWGLPVNAVLSPAGLLRQCVSADCGEILLHMREEGIGFLKDALGRS